MVESFKNSDDCNDNMTKRYVVSLNNLVFLKNKQIYDFINSSSMKLFGRFDIATDFLQQNPAEWYTNENC